MKSPLIDTSSVILLAHVGLFLTVCDFYNLKVVPNVYKEITYYKRPFSDLFTDCYKQGRIELVQPPQNLASLSSQHLRLTRLHSGEQQTLYRFLAAGEEDFIIIDDGKAAGFCRDEKIPYINSLLCPKILYYGGRLGKKSYQNFSAELIQKGRYAPWVIKTAGRLTKQDLDDFL